MGGWSRFTRRLRFRAYRQTVAIRLPLVLLTGLGVSLVFVSGPYVQSAFTSFLSGSKSSLYAGMYASGIGGFPTVGDYFRQAFWPPYLFSGMVVAAAMAWFNAKIRFLVGVGTVTAVCLTAIDVLNDATGYGLIVSIVCNALGGVILALLSFLIISKASVLHHVSEGNKYIERVIWIIYPAVCFVILTAVLIFVLAFLIKIPTASVSLRLAPPMSGSSSPVDPLRCGAYTGTTASLEGCHDRHAAKKNDDEFNVLAKFTPVSGSETKWVGLGKNLSVAWKKNNNDAVSTTFRMAEGCTTREQLEKIVRTNSRQGGTKMGIIRIDVDSGLSQFRLLGPSDAGKVEIGDSKSHVSEFWVIPDTANSTKVNFSRFIYDGYWHVNDTFDDFSYEIGLFLIDGEKRAPKARRLHLVSSVPDKSTYIDVRFDEKRVDPNGAVKCKMLKLESVGEGYVVTASEPLVSLIVSVDHNKDVAYSDLDSPDILAISGINGWVSSDDFDKSRVDLGINAGTIGMLSVFGTISDVQVNGKGIATGPTSTLQLTGELFARSDGPAILVSGDADYMILNDQRLTLTRWESLDTAIRVPIIFGVPTVLYFLLRMLVDELRRTRRHLWYLPR